MGLDLQFTKLMLPKRQNIPLTIKTDDDTERLRNSRMKQAIFLSEIKTDAKDQKEACFKLKQFRLEQLTRSAVGFNYYKK